MRKNNAERTRIKNILAQTGASSWTCLQHLGASRTVLRSMVNDGEVVRTDHNVYQLGGATPEKYPHWSAVAAKYPGMVICLLSAAQFHGLTSQLPDKTWIALPPGSKPSNSTVRCVRWPETDRDGKPHRLWHAGIENVSDVTASYRITGPARTVVDLCRWARGCGDIREGQRTFLEALGSYCDRGFELSDLWEISRIFGLEARIRDLMIARSAFTESF